MSKPINLNRVRKDKARAEKRAKADENAVKYGRSKAEKAQHALEAERSVSKLDGHKRDRE